ncbi:RidA family protein [Oceanibium sediminis]|uniref:RidA family protein n=1 Tax=Oceanibium sediminis TaxID=2026339 RepID=UPI000DD2CF92|nr:RidA family protein [Oceanibium sediminis]
MSKISDQHYAIGTKNPNLPFYPAVRAGDYIYVSGQVSKDENGNMIQGSIEIETANTIKAIERIIAEEGATLKDVVRVTTYLEDMRDFGRYNAEFKKYFDRCVIARTTVQGSAAINVLIEMEAIVYKPL